MSGSKVVKNARDHFERKRETIQLEQQTCIELRVALGKLNSEIEKVTSSFSELDVSLKQFGYMKESFEHGKKSFIKANSQHLIVCEEITNGMKAKKKSMDAEILKIYPDMNDLKQN